MRQQSDSSPTDAQWHSLIDAIIVSAIANYRRLTNKMRRGMTLTQSEEYELFEIRSFFASDWFDWLCPLNGADLLTRLNEETTFIRTNSILP